MTHTTMCRLRFRHSLGCTCERKAKNQLGDAPYLRDLAQRKCSFRFLLVVPGARYVVTQDMRRRRSPITGKLRVQSRAHDRKLAKAYGCSMIVRHKR
jgi:hypothetical protein